MTAGNRHFRVRGAAAIEFALILPVFIAFMMGCMELSWLFYQQSTLDFALNMGCRSGSLKDVGTHHANFTTLRDGTAVRILDELARADGTFCTDCATSVSVFGTPPLLTLECSVTRPFRPLFGVVLDSIVLSSTMVVRMEWQRDA